MAFYFSTEVETNQYCVFPFLRSSGALRGVVKAKRSCAAAAPLERRKEIHNFISFHL